MRSQTASDQRAAPTIEAATDADIFLAYLDHGPCRVLRPGNVVVMDNLSSHKVQGGGKRIQRAGAELLYLPPYSPDLNPIEKAWAKLKQLVCSEKPRTNEALQQPSPIPCQRLLLKTLKLGSGLRSDGYGYRDIALIPRTCLWVS